MLASLSSSLTNPESGRIATKLLRQLTPRIYGQPLLDAGQIRRHLAEQAYDRRFRIRRLGAQHRNGQEPRLYSRSERYHRVKFQVRDADKCVRQGPWLRGVLQTALIRVTSEATPLGLSELETLPSTGFAHGSIHEDTQVADRIAEWLLKEAA